MRTTTAGELTVLASNTRAVTYRVKVENGSGTMKDLTSWVHHISWDSDIDQPVSGATVYFVRADGATQSLSPLRTDSTLNLKDDLVTISAQIDPGRKLTIEVATTAIGATVGAGDYKLMFVGVIDVVNFEDSPIAAVCRDEGGLLVDRFTGANWAGTGPVSGSGTVSKILDVATFSTSQVGAIENGDIVTVDGVDYIVSNFTGSQARLKGSYDFNFSGRPFTITATYRSYKIYGTTPGTGTVSSGIGAATFSVSQAGLLADDYTITVNNVEYTISAFDGTTHATLNPGIPSFGSSSFTINARAVELVMQDILDDAVDDGPVPIAITLNTPVSPVFLITEYKQQNQSVMEALLALAGTPGWDVRYWFDEGSGTFKFTLRDPNRAKTTPDYTFGPSQYFNVSKLNVDRTKVRNYLDIIFFDRALKNWRRRSVGDSTSQSRYGFQYLRIDEPEGSPINSVVEADTKITAILSDLKDPKAEQEIELPFFWPAELGDLYRHSPNSVHYTANQDYAVVRIEHELGPGNHRTKLLTRGSPAVTHLRWLGPPRLIPVATSATVIDPSTGEILLDPTTARFNGTKFIGTGTAPTLSSPDSFWNGTSTVTGTDSAGKIKLDKSTTSSTQHAGHQVKVTFAQPYPVAPYIVLGVPNKFTSNLHFELGAVTASDFWIDANADVLAVNQIVAEQQFITYNVIG